MPVAFTTTAISALAESTIGAGLTGVLGPVLAGGLIGAGSGALGSAIWGKDPGKGALVGGLSGGALGAAGPIASGLGQEAGSIGYDLLSVGLGAAGGAAGQALTGGNVGLGALGGAAAGGVSGLLTPSPATANAALNTPNAAAAPSETAPSAGGASGGGAGASSGFSLSPPADVTAALPAPMEGITINSTPIASPSLLATGAGATLGASLVGQTGGSGPSLGTQNPGQAPSTDKLTDPSGKTTSVGKFMDHPSLGGALDVLGNNPAAVLGVAGLGYELATKPRGMPSSTAVTGNLNNIAGQLVSQGSTLSQYINNGTLPPGAKNALDLASRSAKATLRSRYASMGLSGSTSEATALAQVDQQVAAQTFEIANNLLTTGIKESGMGADIYKAILGETDKQDENLSNSIMNFAAAISGTSPKKAA